MERYVAIDDVCAWPNLSLLPNGEILATIFNQPCHGEWAGDVECWASADGGQTWSRRGVPAPHEPGTSRHNVAAGLARNGDFIVISSGQAERPEKGAGEIPKRIGKTLLLPCWVCRSTDGGRSWSHAETMAPPPGRRKVVPFGKIIALPDGGLGVSAYASRAADGSRMDEAWFFRSDDDGHTWGEPVLIGAGYNETDILCAGGNRLIAAARTQRAKGLALLASEDLGATWTLQEPLTAAVQHPGHLLRLADGAILLSHGIRHRGLYGIGARLSETDGREWGIPMVLLSLDDAYDGGYPSSVELHDGCLVTAYYAKGVNAHPRYHMGVLRWRREEMLSRNRKPEAD